jgi:hypothetical protein
MLQLTITFQRTDFPIPEAIPVIFSIVPTDEEIFGVYFFEEPLVPSNDNLIDEENTDLVVRL